LWHRGLLRCRQQGAAITGATPKGTPKPVVAKLSEALQAAVADPAVRARIEELGAVPATGETATPDYLARMLKSDIERWAVVIKAAGISEPAN
jgi:tripartite-type tricarboxylate transporter receptor subunit TctC